ncbi:MAG: response regulator [Balneolaceae bacterium]
MVQESSIVKQDYIFLMQTKNKNLERQLLNAVAGEDIRLISVEQSRDIANQQLQGQIVSFIIGSDIEDPVQSAQRLHALKKSAKIILLSESEKNAGALKEAIRFSPFLGTAVLILDESKESEMERLKKILQDSLQAEKYKSMIAETNSRISSTVPTQKPAFNQQFISKLMDISPVGITIVSRGGKVLGWNKKAASIFNKNEAQVLGTSLSRLFDDPERKKLETYINESFEGASSTGPIDLELERASGDSIRQILNFTTARFNQAGVPEQALILAIKDETERELARQKLQELNETLEERVEERTKSLVSYQDQLRSLASQLSKAEENERQRLATELHDNLGQMLALAKMKISLIQKHQLPGKAAADIKDLKEGVDEALAYARNLMSDLKPPPSLDKEDIRSSIEWLANRMGKHNLHVIIGDDGQPKPVDDEVRTILLQCIRELLINIIKYAGVNEAAIQLVRVDSEIKIVVEDNGTGFDTDSIHTFSPENGFGLFNVFERIDHLGGRMDIESEPGKGTRVTLFAPLTAEAQKEQLSEGASSETPSAEDSKPDKIKVLLVDDHKMMREGLRKIVEEQDDLMVVAEAADGEEALREAKKTSPDIVVMDVNMPVMDGIEATRTLLEQMPGVRVIGLSLHDHSKVIESMRNAGATAYLTKNEAFETLCATIRSEAKMAKG